MKHPEYWNALREALRQRDSGPVAEDFSAVPFDRLSLSQERLWKVEGLFSDRHCFNLPMAIRIEGSFVLAEFQAAFAELLSRHTVLRMVVDVSSEVPSFSEDVQLSRYWTDFDLSSCQVSDQGPAIERHIAEVQGGAFDLEFGPLFRVRSLMLSTESHVVILVLHQLIFDQWSQSILMNELWELYGARIEGREPALSALKWQFKDYARWQRNILESDETLAKLVAYWRKEFEGCPLTPLEFPRRLEVDGSRRRRRGVSFELSRSLSQEIRVRASDCGVTLFTFLYAGFCVLIHDALGGEEVTIRCPFSNRPREEFQQLIGYFVNLILLRCRMDGDPTFAELLDRVRRTVAGATAHQNLPFHLLSCFDSGEVPRTQIMFSLMNAPQWKGLSDKLHVEPLDVLAEEIDCDLYLTVSQERDRFRCCLQFDETKLDPRMAEDLADGFRITLSKAVAAPTTPVSELGPFSEGSPFRGGMSRGDVVTRPDCFDRESDPHSATRPARRSTEEQVVSRIRKMLRVDGVSEVPDFETSVEPKRGKMSDADRAYVVRTLSEVLGIEPGRLQDGLTLYELGMDSLRMIRLVDGIHTEMGGGLSLQQLGGETTVAELVESVGRLRSSGETDRLPPFVARPDESAEPFPLTDIQQAYWIGRDDSFELGNVSPHAYLEIDGEDLDLDGLSRALQVVIERHPMLRTVVDESGRQRELTKVAPYWIREQGPSGDVSLEDYLSALREEMARGIQSPETWPLFDVRATRLDGTVIRLHISIDLVMLDLASVLQMFDEWHQLYREPGRSLPSLEVTFRDYVIAAETIERSEMYRRSERYWLTRLDSLAASPELPLKRHPREVVQPRFRRREEILDAADWEDLKRRARQRGVTPSSLLLTVYAEVLACWAKEESFTINTTLFHRLPLHQQIGEIMGDFTSLIPLEVDLSRSYSFAGRVCEIHGQLLKDLDHRYFSGVRVLREWAKRRRRIGGALLPVVFTSALSLESMGLSADVLGRFGELVYCVGHTPQVYLDFQIYDHDDGLKLVWDAVDEVFPEGMLDDMFAALCLRIKALAVSESAWDESRPCLVPRTHLDQRREIHETDAALPIRCLHSGFLEMAHRFPESLAVATLDKQLTYGELKKRSLALCGELREKGVRPNQVVGVMLEKGWEQVVAVMGILMSGGGYLPIDRSLPTARQRYMLENGEVAIVVCRDCDLGDLDWPGCVAHWCLLAQESTDTTGPAPMIANDASDLAYVIYTSGSTGEPKGVMIEHRSAMNTILDVGDRFGLKRSDRVLGLSSLSFDLSVFDVFGTLGCGAALILPDADRRKDPLHWLELMKRFDVSVWNSVPMLLQMFVESLAGRKEEVSSRLRLALLSGDWIPLALPDMLRNLWPDLEVIGLGGATEASIWSNFFPIGEVKSEWSSIPYGKPLSNQRLHVLTPELEPCPVWVEGEIFIEGSGLARSYWRDEDKTARAFIEEPRSGRRLYRTGDLGRFLPDGNIEILGRNDLQVKVQGYRIELGEIESVLLAHEKVKQAVVWVQGQRTEAPKLHAVVVMSGEIGSGDAGQAAERGVARASERFPCLPQGLPETVLPVVENECGNENDAALSRRTCRQFVSEAIPLLQLSRLLQCLRPRNRSEAGGLKYRYPSAGSLYPVEVYLSVRRDRIEGLEAGVYFYAAEEHRLIQLGNEAVEERASHFEANRGVFDQSAFSLFLVAQMDAIEPIYGELARDFCLIEVGSMLQELMVRASGVGLGLCPVGWLDAGLLRSPLRLGPQQELLHTIIGGGEPVGPKSSLDRMSHPSAARGDDRELIAYLEQRLPAYMIPESIQVRERLELDSNGKVNRTLLSRSLSPAAKDRRQEKVEDSWAPMEREVAEIWERILGIRKVGTSENFFFLGGNSLMATRVIAQIRMKFNVELPLRDMFANPTVEYTAGVISRKLEESSDAGELEKLLDGLEGMTDDEVRDELANQRRQPSNEGESSGP